MAEDTPRSIPSPRHEGQGRGPRQGDNREAGGFRIRLSDNEMQAARALQEALGLRSTVAVLGFSLRTLAQQLEAGQLDELVAQQRAQGRDRGPAGEGRGEGRGERRGPRDDARSGGGGGNRAPRANPFARPSKPVVSAPPAEPAGDDTAAEPEDSQDTDLNALQEAPEISSAEAASEEAAQEAPSPTPEAAGAVVESAAAAPASGDAEPAPSSEAGA
jgi:hypothetical protein